MKKLLQLLLLSLGLIEISYADDSQEAIEIEIAAFEAKLEAELAAQEIMAEIEAEMARKAALEAFYQKLIDEKRIGGTKPIPFHRTKRLWIADIATKVKSYWNYSGADDDWSCTVNVQQDVAGNVEAVNIQNCNTGSNALMADDKAILDSLKSWNKKLRGKKPIYETSGGSQISVDPIGDEKSIKLFKRF
ncbi:MAG: hypothetical protein H8D28_06565 [Candidatus Thioglobus sp.]|nr:hypothetical protein [Candidatus Pseudothioglobus aerophilus]